MTKKEFKERYSYHQYGKRSTGVSALFFDWKVNDEGRGYKYVVYGRSCNTNKKELEQQLWDLVFNEVETDWHINCCIAQKDSQRFRVPVSASGLRCLIRYEKV